MIIIRFGNRVIKSKEVTQRCAREKHKGMSMLGRIKFGSYHEGLAAQIMHVGPYAEEEPTIAKLHDAIALRGKELQGKHHEIYLGDPRKTVPSKLQTVIRQPMQ